MIKKYIVLTGGIIITYIILICLIIASVISDLKHSKIRNIYVLPAILMGLFINISFYGVQGLKLSMSGMVVPILLLGVLFYARLIGAGDIKLFCAVGALMGLNFVLYAMSYSFIFAGLFALVYLIRRGVIKSTFTAFYQALKMCLLTNDIFYIQNNYVKRIIRLSPAIAAGTSLQMLYCLL